MSSCVGPVAREWNLSATMCLDLLVVRRAHEDLAGELLSCHAVHQDLVSVTSEVTVLSLDFCETASTILDRSTEETTHVLDVDTVERSCVSLTTRHTAHFAHDSLEKLTYGHPGRHSVEG